MGAKLINGKILAASLRDKVAAKVSHLLADHGIIPGLAVVLVGEDPASHVYVNNKSKQATRAGLKLIDHKLPPDTSQGALLDIIGVLNNDPEVHGILVQLPLPEHIENEKILRAIDPAKDVDGFHPFNVGLLGSGQTDRAFVPCTPLGCILMLKHHLADLAGKSAVVIGRSNIVGKPMAMLLLQENCTITLTHSQTRDLPGVCRSADILVAAAGKPEMVRGDWIKPDATVIDVGINRISGNDGKVRLIGDVAFDEARDVAGAITPVPGGVGPMTIACLLANTVRAACLAGDLAAPEWSV